MPATADPGDAHDDPAEDPIEAPPVAVAESVTAMSFWPTESDWTPASDGFAAIAADPACTVRARCMPDWVRAQHPCGA